MTISSSVTSLFNASYSTTIQDALGNSGATATIDGTGALTVTGTPSGAGLKIRAAQSAQSSASSTHDTISLSPAAQAYLTNQQIAFKLLQGGAAKSSSDSTNVNTKTTSDTNGSTTPNDVNADNGSSSETDLSDVTALAQEDPMQVVKDAVSAAENTLASISTTEGFTAAAAANPALIKGFAANFPDGLGNGFMAALKNGTVTVETGEQAGYDVGGGISLTGTSMAVSGASATGPATVDLSKNNQVVADFGFGILAFTWPK